MANVIKHKRGSGSDPVASDLVVGEVAIRTDVGKLFTKMDNGSVAEIAGGGSDIAINTLSSSSGTGGGSATFNGSAFRFTLSAPPSVSAQQLLVSINGVIQKPVAGTGQPSEGFSVDGTDIILGDAPATGSDFFILTFKSLGVSEPADNSVTSAKIADGAIVNADINASAAIDGTKIDPDFGSQGITTTGVISMGNGLTLTGTNPFIDIIDSNNNSDFTIKNDNGTFEIEDKTNSNAVRLAIDSSGRVGIGTTSPDNLLHIESSSNTYLQIEKTGTASKVFLGNVNGEAVLESSGGAVKLKPNSRSNDFVLTTSGKLGLGTSSPTGVLEIDAASTTSMIMLDAGGTNFARIGHNTSSGSNMLDVRSEGHTRFLTGGNNESVRIDSSGQVGIGVTPDTWSTGAGITVGTSQGTLWGAGDQINLSGNAYFNSGWKAAASKAGASQIEQALGNIDFKVSGSVTADSAITFTNAMRINSSGRVGIGTTSPSVKTQISVSNTTAYSASTVDANQFQLSVTNTGANGVAGILLATEPSSGNGGHCGIRALSTGSGNSALTFSTRGGSTQAERMRIDSSGRLLIGTTTGDPYGNRMLTVKSSSSSTAIELRSATNGDGRIIFTDNTTSGDPGSFKCQIKYLQSSDDFIITSNGDNERFRIDSSGNVGIGTTSPTDKLHVVGDVEFELGTELIDVMTTGSGTKYPIRLLNADASAGNKVGIEFGAANNVVCSRIAGIAESDFTSTANRDGGITFESRLNGTLSEAMRIDSSGRLLIGQTSTLGSASSGGKLHVAASISGGGQGVIVATDTSSNDFGCGLIVLKNTTTTSSSQRFIQFYANTDGQPMGGIVGNGSEKAQFIQLSDERWKTNIKPLSGILEKVNKLDVVSFDWKHVNESVEAGFIAQNVQKIFPEYVSENIANEGEEARLGTTGGMAGGYIAILTAAIQELSAKVEALEAK